MAWEMVGYGHHKLEALIMIDIGMKVPVFETTNEKGHAVSYPSDFKDKHVVLYFYPKDNTPGCTIEAKEFSEKKSVFESLDTVILGVSKDSESSHQRFCEKQGLEITLLSDPDMSIIQPYGVWQEKKNYGKTYMGIVRTTYLIHKEGYVVKSWKHVKVKGHVGAVLDEVKAL